MVTPSCPDPAQLVRLLDGELPDAEQAELTRHLDGCASCQRAVEELASGGKSWSETAAQLRGGQPGAECEPALRRAVQELAYPGRPGQTEAEHTTADEAGAGRADELSFLAPPGQPGHLGRLDHYEVHEVVGRGGMGVVLKAFDEKLHRVVAIKVLAPQLATSATARKRFLREAYAAAAVAHEHVVAIHAVEDGGLVPYLVMQFVAGISLEDRIKQTGPLDVKEVLRIGMQAASGLAGGAAQGLVHRDVKPANILLENGIERVKISDFGLARAVDDASLTQSGVIAGTPLFMAPEQARGEAVDHRADLFSLGSVLYTLCTGRPPFRAATTMAVLKRVCEDRPRPIREVNPDVPDWLAAIVMKLLAKDPARRFQSAQQVADLLAQHLAHLQQPHLVARPPSVVTTEHPADGFPPFAFLVGLTLRRMWRSPRKRVALLLVAIWVAAVLGGAAHYWNHYAGHATQKKEPMEKPFQPQPLPTPEELAKRPAAADALNRDDIHPALRQALPPEVVAVLGGPGFALPEGEAGAPAVSADGKMLAVPCGEKVVLFDAHSGRRLQTLRDPVGRVFCAAFSADGKRLATGVGNENIHNVRIWNTETGEAGVSFAAHTGTVNALAFSPDGKKLVSVGSDGVVFIWAKVWNNSDDLVLRGHQGPVNCVAFSPDGKQVVTAGADGTVRVWDATTGNGVMTIAGNRLPRPVIGLAFSPDGQLLASSDEENWWLRDAKTFRGIRTDGPSLGWLAFDPDGQSLLSNKLNNSGDLNAPHVIKRWRIDGKERASFTLKGKGGRAAYALSPDGKTLFEVTVSRGESTLRTYDAATGKERAAQGHAGWLNAVAISPDGTRLASAGEDAVVKLWNLATGELEQTLHGHTAEVYAVAFSPDGQRLASQGKDGTLRLWDFARGKEPDILERAGADSYGLAFSPDGRWLASSGDDGSVGLWDVAARKRVRVLSGLSRPLRLAFSPDSRLLACGSDASTVRVWDVADGQQVREFHGPWQLASSVGFSPDGRWLAAGTDGTVNLWDVTKGAQVGSPWKIADRVFGIGFGPDGRLLAACSGDGVRLRDLTAWPQRDRALRLPADCAGLAFTPEGRYLAVPCNDGLVYVLRLAKRGEVPRPPADAGK